MSEWQNGKTLVRLLLQHQSDLGLQCLSLPFWQEASVQILGTSTLALFSIKFNNNADTKINHDMAWQKVLSDMPNSTLTLFFFVFLVDEGREDPTTTKSGPSSAWYMLVAL